MQKNDAAAANRRKPLIKKDSLLDLFLTFCRIGVLTFGGGYSMLPMLQREVTDKHGWATEQELLDYYAVGQCTPGIIAVNTATFIGHKTKGIAGGIVATLGIITPSLLIITVIAACMQNFANEPIVQHAFSGIRVGVCVLILNAVIKLWKSGIKDLLGIIIFVLVLALSVIFSLSPVFVVLGAIAVGITSGIVREKAAKNKKGGDAK